MSKVLRQYRRDLGLYVLSRAQSPMPAAELAECMEMLAKAESHPEPCWRGLDGGVADGVLRRLEREGLVEKAGTQRDTRRGKDRPTWRCALGSSEAMEARLPAPPDLDEAEPPPQSPYEGMTREQMYAVLDVSDQYMVACAQFVSRIAELNNRARRRLAEVGLRDGELPG